MNTGWLERARNNRVKRREGGRERMRGKWIDEERKKIKDYLIQCKMNDVGHRLIL